MANATGGISTQRVVRVIQEGLRREVGRRFIATAVSMRGERVADDFGDLCGRCGKSIPG